MVNAFILFLLLSEREDSGNREQLRQDLGRLAGRVVDVERNARAPLGFEEAADGGVSAGPVADQDGDLLLREGSGDILALEHGLLVDLAGDAPVGGEVSEDGPALRPKRGEPLLAELFGRQR